MRVGEGGDVREEKHPIRSSEKRIIYESGSGGGEWINNMAAIQNNRLS